MSGRHPDRRLSRRTMLGGAVLAVALAGGGYGYRSFTRARDAALLRIAGRSEIIDTAFGALEYAETGAGAPILMIHGAGGGFDQGLTFGEAIAERGWRIIAPSRFGYLRSDFPDDPSAANQADVFAALLDYLGIDRLAVIGGSAGALPAAEFALRHPDRCSALILLVPAANVANRDPVEMSPLVEWSVRRVLESDALFWMARRAAPKRLIGTLLATDPALLDTVSVSERARAYRILDDLMPVSPRARGALNDARIAGQPASADFAGLRVPTLILSVEDDRFGTAGTARKLAGTIPGARLRIYPDGGHIWLGHDHDIARDIADFAAAHL